MFSVWPGCSHRDALTFHGFAADRPTLPVLAFAGMLLTRVFARHRRVRRASPLIQAIGDHNVPAIKQLLALGADPCVRGGRYGLSPWVVAIGARRQDIVDLLAPYHCTL
jgi:hypothetical protein